MIVKEKIINTSKNEDSGSNRIWVFIVVLIVIGVLVIIIIVGFTCIARMKKFTKVSD